MPRRPQRFEAGTPAIVEAIGLARRSTMSGIGLEAIHAHETALVAASARGIAQ
jgi:cysteine desulfurase/selenocysteine lyase